MNLHYVHILFPDLNRTRMNRSLSTFHQRRLSWSVARVSQDLPTAARPPYQKLRRGRTPDPNRRPESSPAATQSLQQSRGGAPMAPSDFLSSVKLPNWTRKTDTKVSALHLRPSVLKVRQHRLKSWGVIKDKIQKDPSHFKRNQPNHINLGKGRSRKIGRWDCLTRPRWTLVTARSRTLWLNRAAWQGRHTRQRMLQQ